MCNKTQFVLGYISLALDVVKMIDIYVLLNRECCNIYIIYLYVKCTLSNKKINLKMIIS